MLKCVSFIAAALLTGSACALEPFAVADSNLLVKVGGDVRGRFETFDNMIGGRDHQNVGGKYWRQFRFRARPYVELDADRFTLFTRMAWAWRDYSNYSGTHDKGSFPDEFFVDNLYLQATNLFDFLDFRIGRQDYVHGSGRVFMDGTPGDGGRSIYFDMIRLTTHLTDKTSIDWGLIWNHYRNVLAIGNPNDDWDLTMYGAGGPLYGHRFSKLDEKGAFVYADVREIDWLPMEFYWIWKDETRSFRYSAADGTRTRYPGRTFNTIGTRLLPKLGEVFSGEFEGALQVGDDVLAGMVYGGASAKTGMLKSTLACLYYSGDRRNYYLNDNGKTDHAWNPAFGRSPSFSEYYCINGYDNARWSNLVYPHLHFEIDLADWLDKGNLITWQTGPMLCAVKDEGAPSHNYGWFQALSYDFPILPKFLNVKGLKGRLMYETLSFGDYYRHHGSSPGSFFRIDVVWKF